MRRSEIFCRKNTWNFEELGPPRVASGDRDNTGPGNTWRCRTCWKIPAEDTFSDTLSRNTSLPQKKSLCYRLQGFKSQDEKTRGRSDRGTVCGRSGIPAKPRRSAWQMHQGPYSSTKLDHDTRDCHSPAVRDLFTQTGRPESAVRHIHVQVNVHRRTDVIKSKKVACLQRVQICRGHARGIYNYILEILQKEPNPTRRRRS